MRTRGSRNARYDQRRAELLDRLTTRLCQRDGGWPTMRDLASAAECSVSTLAHYFGRREDVVRAVFHHIAAGTEDQLEATRQPEGDFPASVQRAAQRASEALNDPIISRLLSMGLIEALSAGPLGPAFLGTLLDPFVDAMVERLSIHIRRGEMRAVDPRMAALDIISPILLAALHQHGLGGRLCNPLDPASHVTHVAGGFVTAYGTRSQARDKTSRSSAGE